MISKDRIEEENRLGFIFLGLIEFIKSKNSSPFLASKYSNDVSLEDLESIQLILLGISSLEQPITALKESGAIYPFPAKMVTITDDSYIENEIREILR